MVQFTTTIFQENVEVFALVLCTLNITIESMGVILNREYQEHSKNAYIYIHEFSSLVTFQGLRTMQKKIYCMGVGQTAIESEIVRFTVTQ